MSISEDDSCDWLNKIIDDTWWNQDTDKVDGVAEEKALKIVNEVCTSPFLEAYLKILAEIGPWAMKKDLEEEYTLLTNDYPGSITLRGDNWDFIGADEYLAELGIIVAGHIPYYAVNEIGLVYDTNLYVPGRRFTSSEYYFAVLKYIQNHQK